MDKHSFYANILQRAAYFGTIQTQAADSITVPGATQTTGQREVMLWAEN